MKSLNSIENIEQLPSHIVQFLSLLERFYNVLLSESQSLKTNNSEKLSSLLPSKSQLSEEISQLTQIIESLLKTQQLSLSHLFNLPPSSKLPHPLQQNIERIVAL